MLLPTRLGCEANSKNHPLNSQAEQSIIAWTQVSGVDLILPQNCSRWQVMPDFTARYLLVFVRLLHDYLKIRPN